MEDGWHDEVDELAVQDVGSSCSSAVMRAHLVIGALAEGSADLEGTAEVHRAVHTAAHHWARKAVEAAGTVGPGALAQATVGVGAHGLAVDLAEAAVVLEGTANVVGMECRCMLHSAVEAAGSAAGVAVGSGVVPAKQRSAVMQLLMVAGPFSS